jgi:hypothetical protein
MIIPGNTVDFSVLTVVQCVDATIALTSGTIAIPINWIQSESAKDSDIPIAY